MGKEHQRKRKGDKGMKGIKERKEGARNEDMKEIIPRSV
jgi:hypothetical protein